MKNNIYKEKTITRINKKYNLLGKDPKVIAFLNIRLIISLVIFILFAILLRIGIVIGPIISILFYYLFEYFYFDFRIKSRKKKIENDATIFFGLVLVSLKSDKDLISSLNLACKKKDNILATEFSKVLNHIEYGRSLDDTFNDIKKRIPSDSVNNIILSISQSSDNIVNLVNLLERQLSQLQNKIVLSKKRRINLIPTKIRVLTLIFLLIGGLIVYFTLKGLEFI